MRKNNENKGIENLKVKGACFGAILLIGAGGFALYKENESHEFKYVTAEDGTIERKGTISYEDICENWRLVEKKLVTGKSKLFIVDANLITSGAHDVKTGKSVVTSLAKIGGSYNDTTILNVQELDEYLLAYDMVKGSYDSKDIDTLLSLIEADYEYQNNKELIKE